MEKDINQDPFYNLLRADGLTKEIQSDLSIWLEHREDPEIQRLLAEAVAKLHEAVDRLYAVTAEEAAQQS